MSHQTVIVLDFGGQYNQLIARRVREQGVYSEVKPCATPIADLKALDPIGILFTGGPGSVYDPAAPQADPELFRLGVPILGICYGCQLLAHNLAGRSPPPRTIPPGSTARPKPPLTRAASSSGASPPKASPG